MTRYLLDTSVLVRLANVADADHPTADAAVGRLVGRNDVPVIAPQGLIEFRSVATRPKQQNGLDLSPAEAERKAAKFESLFPLVPDTDAVYPMWRTLVSAYGVKGKQVHDARMAAVCSVNNVTHVLTFNVQHFTRYAAHPPGLVVVHPSRV